MMPRFLIKRMAMMTDEEFIEFAAKFSYTPKPDPEGESIGDFRQRVVHTLDS